MKNLPIRHYLTVGISLGLVVFGGSKLLNFALKLAVSRLGVTNFGDYYIATSTFVSIATLTTLGIPMSTTRFVSYFRGLGQKDRSKEIISSAITISGIASILAGCMLFGTAEWLAALLGITHAALYFKILSFGLIGASLSLLVRAILLGYLHVQTSYALEGVETVSKFLFVLMGIWVFRLGVLGAVVGYTLGIAVSSAINYIALTKKIHVSPFTSRISQNLITFAWPVSASEIITAISATTLIFILRIAGGGEEVGYYAAAVSVAGLIHVIPQMILPIFLPVISQRYGEQKSIRAVYKTVMTWLGFTVGLLTLGIIGLNPIIMRVLFDSSYSRMTTVLPVLAAAYGFYAIFVWPHRQLLDMAGYTKHNLALTILRSAVSIASLLLVFQRASGTGVAAAILLGWIAEGIGCMYLIMKKRLILPMQASVRLFR